MPPESTPPGNEPRDSSPPRRRAVVDDHQFDRRTIIRATGAVLLAGSLAGCSHNGDGDDDDGPYSIDAPVLKR